MSVFGYCRVSGQKQVKEGISLEVQQRQIEGWCMIAGETLFHTYVEEGVSGSIPVNKRPQGSIMTTLIAPGDTIVTSRLDRLFRSALDALQTVEWAQKKKIKIVIIDSLGDITGNGMAKAFLTISAAFAELERDTISERIANVKADQKNLGRYLGGKVPYGHRVSLDGYLVVDEIEQKIIKWAKDMRAEGKTLRHIQRVLKMAESRPFSLDMLSRITKAET